jgi:hypothetical protein
MDESTANEGPQRPTATRCLNRGPPDVTRFRSATAKRVQAHRARARMGLRCLTVRVSDRDVRQPFFPLRAKQS